MRQTWNKSGKNFLFPETIFNYWDMKFFAEIKTTFANVGKYV